MQITDVRVKLVSTESKMKAVASITLDDSFVIRDIKVIDGQDKLFIAMPSRKMPDGEYKDIAHPINSQTRQMVEEAILQGYQAEIEALAEMAVTV